MRLILLVVLQEDNVLGGVCPVRGPTKDGLSIVRPMSQAPSTHAPTLRIERIESAPAQLPQTLSPFRQPTVAVVLAAGRAERLRARTSGASKATLTVGGMPLLERSVRTLLAAGIEHVVVVLGHDADAVERCLDALPHGRAQSVRAHDWELGNGASLMAAAPMLAGEDLFLAVTADHLFSSGALRPVLEAGAPAVLVDPSPGVAWEGGTRVRVVDGCVAACGKDLEEPAIDCGVFLMTPAIIEAYAAAAARGDYSLAGLVTEFAHDVPVHVVALPLDAWWCDIDTPDDLERARELVRRSLGKTSDGPISRALNRPLSTRISIALAGLRPSPMRLTLLTSVVGLIAALLLAVGQGIAAGILAQLTSVLDGVDGETARLQFRETAGGHFVDGLLDRIVDTALIAGLGIWAASQGAPAGVLSALVAAATAAVLLSMATKDRLQLMGLRRSRDTFGSHLLAGRDGRLLIVALGSIAGLPLLALAIVAVTSGMGVFLRLVYVLRSPEAGG